MIFYVSCVLSLGYLHKYSMGNSTFYKWREKYGGMETSYIKRLKELEAENRKLKQMFAELSLKSQLQEEIIKKL